MISGAENSFLLMFLNWIIWLRTPITWMDGSILSWKKLAEEDARTSDKMIYWLRFRDAKEKLGSAPLLYVKLRNQLLGAWPSVTNGGCRFLIQSREWFPVQMRILSRAKIQWSGDRVIRARDLKASTGVVIP